MMELDKRIESARLADEALEHVAGGSYSDVKPYNG